jgi:hypothetical protein
MKEKFLSFKDVAKLILQEAGEPLSPREIVERALDKGILRSEGDTPEATMGAQLYVDVQRNAQSPFAKAGRGKFSLREQKESAASASLIIEKQNELVRHALRKRLFEMDPFQFEFLVGDLLRTLGYINVEVTKRAGDKGIDVMADLSMEGITNVKTIVQVKRFRDGNKISGSTVRQLRGSAAVDQRGLVITTSGFTKDAVVEAMAPNKMPVALVDGDKLIGLLIRNEVGVRKELYPVYSINTDYFDNAESEETSIHPSGKNRGIWPLPGGLTAYVDTLFKVLNAVGDGHDTNDRLIQWFMKTFDVVKSSKTALGYVGVPRTIGLTEVTDGKIRLTDAGARVLDSQDVDYLFEVFASNVYAVDEIMEFFKTSNAPQTEEDVLKFLQDNLNVGWTTFAQVHFRLLWLVNMGKLSRSGDSYQLV